jgi:hypothetical protein
MPDFWSKKFWAWAILILLLCYFGQFVAVGIIRW